MSSDLRARRYLRVLLRGVAALAFALIGVSAVAQTAAGGAGHTVVLASDGTVWTVGANTHGQLGDHTTTTRRTPIKVGGLSDIAAVAAGANHTMALTRTGRLYLWGDNANGQVGSGASTRKTPVRSNLRNVVAIAAGASHSVALQSNGDVYTWGRNTNGQLGNGSTTPSTSPVRVATGVAAIAAGFNHTLFVTSDGSVYATGLNAHGQLGDGTTTRRTSPVRMNGIATATRAAGGQKFSVVLLSDGTLVATGDNSHGQLGDGTTTQRTSPVPVSTLTNVTALAAGAGHVLALDSGRSVWAWGLNGNGQVGDGTTTNRSTPTHLTSISSITTIGAGRHHSLAVTLDGVVHAWGRNARSQIGDGTTVDRPSPTAISGANYDWKVSTPSFNVAAGTYTTTKTVRVSIATTGATIRYTRNGNEPTESDPSIASGDGVTITTSQTLKAKAFKDGMPPSNTASVVYELKVATPTVTPVGGTYASPQTVTMSTSSPGATLRYTTDGSTPTESSPNYAGPLAIATRTTLCVAGFRTGWTTSAVITGAYTMQFGALQPPVITPAAGGYEGAMTVTLSSAQAGATIWYTTDGTMPAQSSTAYAGPIAIGTTTTLRAMAFHPDYTGSAEASSVYTISASTPTLSVPSGTYPPGSVVTISTSDAASTLRMTLDGTDPTAGSPVVAPGTSMLLGAFTLKVRAFKAGVSESAVVSGTYALTTALGAGAISAGGSHTVLATPDGLVYAWGLNSSGQLGDGTFTTRLAPTLVQTFTGATSLAAGQAHTLARTWDGQVYAWGANDAGQVGDGTTDGRSRPVHVSALTNIVAVAAGDRHSLALTTDGRVLAWGLGDRGQLGLGSTLSHAIPTEVPTLQNIVGIAAGDAYSLAVTADGQLYGWGSNASSTLGDGTTTTRTSPVLVGLSNVVDVAAAASHSLALLRSGAVYAWGLGASGQLGLGTTTMATTPMLVPGLTASAIAARGDHSAAILGDGTLVGWGANGSGQVGDSSTTNRTVATMTAGTGSVSRIALGDAHAIAVAPDGNVWTWGEAGSGQLGDGGTTNRATPYVVMANIGNWAPAAPVLGVASGTFSVRQPVSITSSSPGATVRYTFNGTDPIETDPEVPAAGVVDIDESAQLRARAWVSGRLPGAIARADYMLQVAAPVITPATGTYTSAQTVTLTSSDALAALRYTLDGTDPTASSTLYTDPFLVDTSVTVTARAFRPGAWLASEVAQAVLQVTVAPAAPTARPAGGVYPEAQSIALSFAPDATIRYTLDGRDPSAVSNLYVTPLPVTTGTTVLKALAFRADGTESAVLTASYTIDTVPPTITASLSSAALNGWHIAPVTVTFTCQDSVGIASCPSPVTIASDGVGQLVSGVAVDYAGRQTSLTVTVNLDLTPPDVILHSPADGLVTTDTTVLLTGQASDLVSGLVAATCNGVTATRAGDQATCTVSLRPGVNALVLHARDAAGHTASASVRVTRVGTATRLSLAPAERTLLVDEVASLSLTDDFGAAVLGATWTTSDPVVVSLSTDDPPVLTALAAGAATITATKNGLTAEATLTVLAGTSLPEGTTRWRVAPTPGRSMGTPIYTHRVDATVPDLFIVEWDEIGAITVRAASAAGEVPWSAASPGWPLMGDAFGGLIAGVNFRYTATGERYAAYARVAGPASAPPWRYESGPAGLSRPAQAPDGTLYAVESRATGGKNSDGTPVVDTQVIVLDGATGQVRARVPLAREVVVGFDCKPSWRVERAPTTVGPIVGADGYGYLVVRQRTWVASGTCQEGNLTIAQDVGLTLLRVSPTGTATPTVILAQHCSGYSYPPTICDLPPEPHQLLPDGVGGTLVTARYYTSAYYEYGFPRYAGERRVTRVDASGSRIDAVIGDDYVQTIGQAGTAYVWRSGTLSAVDATTWTTKWTIAEDGNVTAALPTGGVALQRPDSGDLRILDEYGALQETRLLGVTNVVQELGGWVHASSLGLTLLAGAAFDDATRWSTWVVPGVGNRQGQLQMRRPGIGLWIKTHNVVAMAGIEFQHASIKIVPTNQQWLLDRPIMIGGTDDFGNKFFTIGAGTGEGDTSSTCAGTLTKGINRLADVVVPAKRLGRIPVWGEFIEGGAIISLLLRYNGFGDNLPYTCNPEAYTGFYNSNSFAHGLLHAAAVPHNEQPIAVLPGWRTPVPVNYFYFLQP